MDQQTPTPFPSKPMYVVDGIEPGDFEYSRVYRVILGGYYPEASPAAARLILMTEDDPLEDAQMLIRRLRSGGDDADYQAAAVATAVLAVAKQLVSIDDALRNTIGGTPR
jgi:hypothetical protein